MIGLNQKKLDDLLLSANKTPADVSREMGRASNYVAVLLMRARNGKPIKRITAKRIADAIGVAMEDLIVTRANGKRQRRKAA